MLKPNCVAAALLCGVCLPALSFAAAPELSPVVVTAPTPLADPAASLVPVQAAGAVEIERSHALDLTAFLRRELGGVYLQDVQSNPLQPDVNYRGYTASPLLGTPQGLSVYLDGVRQNQPFGDLVSWDLIPRAAIASIALIPGSDPLFGLNTLGGALSVRTKDGNTAAGSSVQAAYGSYRRWQVEAETGGHAENGLNWYLTANRFQDNGWREASPSKASQAFGKLGWRDGATTLSVSGAYAWTDLTGNGLQEQRLLDRDNRSVYTKPDNSRNQSRLVELAATHAFSDRLSFSGNAYYRKLDSKTFNGDINDASLTGSVYQPTAAERAVLIAAGYTGVPIAGESAANTPFPSWRCIADALLDSEPNETCNGLLNRTATRQPEAGLSGQFTLTAPLGRHANQLVVGGAYSSSRARFVQSSQFGYLTPDRGVVGVAGPGAFADGAQASEDAIDARVDLTGRTRVASLYAADTLALAPHLALTLSGRYDDSRVADRDAFTPAGPGSLTGDHRFARFNPAVALTWGAADGLGAYARWNQGSRAPSAIELGCADPANPCRLPNAFAGDPPLREVTTRTVEAGLHGRALGRLNWSAGVFRADNRDDILFVAGDVSGFGYFKNFGQTRRQGFELGLDGRFGRVSLRAHYTYLDAAYRSPETLAGAGNSSNDIGPGFAGNIAIVPGDPIPLVPRNLFKASLGFDATDQLHLDADMVAASGVYARGDENGRHQPDGVFYLGPGRTAGYAVVNLGLEYRPAARVKLFLQADNVFDKRYASAAQLGATGFTATGAFLARPFAGPVIGGERPVVGATFYAPGAPRILWGGIKLSL